MTTHKEKGKNFIEHFGVKGMKWGVRRSPAQLRSGSKGDDNPSSKPKAAAKSESSSGNSRNPKKSVAEMSDKDLKAYVNRLQMEQQYAKMQPTPFSKKAQKFALDIVTQVAKQQLTNALSKQVGEQMEAIKIMKRPGAPKLPSSLKGQTLPKFAKPGLAPPKFLTEPPKV